MKATLFVILVVLGFMLGDRVDAIARVAYRLRLARYDDGV